MLLMILGGVFLALCLFAALHDLNSLTIPNWVNLTLALLFIPAAAVSGLPLEMIGGHLLAGAAAFVIAFALFAFNIFGGGDAKMIPAVILWMGPDTALPFTMSMALAGGAMAFLILMVRKSMPAEAIPGPVRAAFEEKAGVPYGVAIAAGVFLAGSGSPLLTGLLSQLSVFS